MQLLAFGGIWEFGLAIGDLIWAFVFVLLYAKICSERTPKEAAGFGVLIGLLFASPVALGFFPLTTITHVDPDFSDWILEGVIPSVTVLYWFVLTVMKITLCGIVAGLVYRTA